MEETPVSKRLKKEHIFTIPNAMSAMRIVMLPFIVWLFVEQKYVAAIVLIGVSCLTDIFDGKIARRFNMVSDVGKVLDPLADKLTQGVLCICLAIFHYPLMWGLVGLFVVKETIIVIVGWVLVQKADVVPGAKWYGKLNTVILFFSFGVILLYLLITGEPLDTTIANALIGLCAVSITVSMILYLIEFFRLLKASKEKEE